MVLYETLQEIYLIKEPKTLDSPRYMGISKENWSITARDYIREVIRQIEGKLGIML
jgi:hypothetical protein